MKGLWLRLGAAAGAALLLLVLALGLLIRVPKPTRPFLPFPPGKDCAIAITDDTDFFQFPTTLPVYDLLDSLGIRLTKTVWVFDHEGSDPARVGLSLRNPAYRRWVLAERDKGHEITMHSATSGDDPRDLTLAAFDTIRALTGDYPRLEIFHSGNKEALYWGGKRIPNRFLRRLYDLKMRQTFQGDEPSSPLYWLDVSRDRVRYLRTFTFNDMDTWAVNPTMPYLDPATPGAPLWFASSNARWGEKFSRLFRPSNVEQLKRGHGVSVIYTHFGLWFTKQDATGRARLRDDVREALLRTGSDHAIEWVPAGELLDRMRVAQWVEQAVLQGSRTVALPLDAEHLLRRMSVEPSAIPGRWKVPAAAREGARIDLATWLNRASIRPELVARSYLDGAAQIPALERWRLTWKWLVTQLVSPT
ncbi:MAG: hypothetical protein U0527_11335 [Candidatus Eisenbacteria bacterium]